MTTLEQMDETMSGLKPVLYASTEIIKAVGPAVAQAALDIGSLGEDGAALAMLLDRCNVALLEVFLLLNGLLAYDSLRARGLTLAEATKAYNEDPEQFDNMMRQ